MTDPAIRPDPLSRYRPQPGPWSLAAPEEQHRGTRQLLVALTEQERRFRRHAWASWQRHPVEIEQRERAGPGAPWARRRTAVAMERAD